jgi:hypothetical protein
MKFALPVLVALTLFGCSQERTPTAPNPPIGTALPTPTPGAAITSLWGFVVEPSGSCITDAMVEVVHGQAQGQRIMQETPCDAWAYGGGFVFKELSPGEEMTLRASAPGWSTEEQTVVPHLGGQTAVLISLKKL